MRVSRHLSSWRVVYKSIVLPFGRYEELLRKHILPVLGERKLQSIHSTDIDKLYLGLEGKISRNTAHHVHSVFNACLAKAVATGKLAVSPMKAVTTAPCAVEADHGVALDEQELRALVRGFEGSVYHGIVSVAAFTGARRNEILALRWTDLDPGQQDAADRASAWRKPRSTAFGLRAPKGTPQAHNHDRR